METRNSHNLTTGHVDMLPDVKTYYLAWGSFTHIIFIHTYYLFSYIENLYIHNQFDTGGHTNESFMSIFMCLIHDMLS